jgi:hypothetical protein
MGMIKSIQSQALGNPVVSKDMVEDKRQIIHNAFYRDVFVQLSSLSGDRRTTTEIIERIREGLRRLAVPVARLQGELLNPVIMRSLRILRRHGRIPLPPQQLEEQNLSIKHKSELARALEAAQSRGFMQFSAMVGQLVEVFPDAIDILNIDRALPDLAESFGVKTEHISTPEEIAQKRAERAAAQRAQELLAAGQQVGEAYNKTSGAPEEGSPAGEVMEALQNA